MNILDSQLDYIPPPARAWSPYQHAVFEAVRAGDDNLIIQAVAGSGKTTTIIEAMQFAGGGSLFLAFNKSIALDIAKRLTSGEAKTLNALGHRQWLTNRPLARLEAKKTSLILAKLLGEGSEIMKDYGWTLSKIIGLAKNNAIGIGDSPPMVADFADLIDAYQLDVPAERIDNLAEIALAALALSTQDETTFDFDDQLYMPALLDWDYPTWSNVFIDECQDLSPIQHLMLNRLAAKGARLIAVGDRHQAIYGFRGALSDSMQRLKGRFGMLELPLSISYRCARAIVDEAKVLCPSIESSDSASAGLVWTNDEDPTLFHNTLVVCRNNAPLFRAILGHVRAKSPCQVLSNFLESFQGFLRSFKVKTTSELLVKLGKWFNREVEAAESKGFRGKVAGLTDKYLTTELLCKEYTTVDEVLRMVKSLGDSTTGPVFATIHKAKGLEHSSVYILRPDLMPAPYATSADQKQQESNLRYVAITRAKDRLVYGYSQR